MTIQDIKKALEICTDIDRPCADCPYDNVTNCSDTLKHDMYKLAIEQEREIERLKAGTKQAQIDVLNKLKEKLGDYEDHCLEMHDWQGQTAICECEEYIDELRNTF